MRLINIKEYPFNNEYRFKLIFMNMPIYKEERIKDRSKNKINDVKLMNNISRAKQKIIEYCLCNKWDYFVTFTLDEKKQDRFDSDLFLKQFLKWINNYNSKNDKKVKYILIPELHADGAIHVHGVLSGLDASELFKFKKDMKLPYGMLKKLENGFELFSWCAYADRFGYNNLEVIKNNVAMSFYVIKYITKTPAVIGKGKRLFVSSQGLEIARKISMCVGSEVDLPVKYGKYLKYEFCDIAYTDDISKIENDDFIWLGSEAPYEIFKEKKVDIVDKRLIKIDNGYKQIEF